MKTLKRFNDRIALSLTAYPKRLRGIPILFWTLGVMFLIVIMLVIFNFLRFCEPIILFTGLVAFLFLDYARIRSLDFDASRVAADELDEKDEVDHGVE